MLSDRVFQRILPLDDRELCPCVYVLTFDTLSRFSVLRIYLLDSLVHSYISQIATMDLFRFCF